jgi:hypothetical protein
MKFVVDAHLPERNLPAIEAALESHTLVEIHRLAVKPVA